MSVKLKTLFISTVSFLLFLAITIGISYLVFFKFIINIEDTGVNNSFRTFDSIIDREENGIKRTSLDWAHWDDTYNFMFDKNQEYIKSNLVNQSLRQLNLSFIIFLDKDNKVFYEIDGDIDNRQRDILIDKITNIRYKKFFNPDKIDADAGAIYAYDKLFIISEAPITTSDEKAKSNGTLVMGRYVDKELMNYINESSKANITFKGLPGNSHSLSEISIARSYDKISAYRNTKDINEESSILISMSIERYAHILAINYIKIFCLLYIVALFMILVLNNRILDKYVLKRLKLLDDFVERVRKTKDTTLRLVLAGNDELSKIADSTSNMVAELAIANNDVKEMDERFRLIMEATKDGYLDLDLVANRLYINREWKQELGYTSKNENGLFYEHFSKIHPEFIEYLSTNYTNIINNNDELFDITYKMIKDTGEIIWVLERGKIVSKDEKGRPTRILSIVMDITERKKYEEEILFLSYSDKLTGLSNRAYMEKQFEELDKDKNSSYFIIMGDVNGLKLINDALGHKIGDKLIYNVSNEMKNICDHNDVVSRWSGDEFIILIKNREKDYVEDLIAKIKQACDTIKDFPISISIALGYAEKDDDNKESEAVMSVAEKRMYRNKLIEKKSTRNAITSSLLRTLHEKHSETEEHTMRIKNMSFKLGKRMGLPQDKLDELELLGLLHDIGKIGIPEQILLKPAKLTAEEWVVMKSHTEIGYRIAKSTPELSHIADEILSHHERYDGTGYPNGLKAEEIPLLARIINVVDSFDVMTHKREYKLARDMNYGIEELKRCSSTQFDPHIVAEFLELLQEDDENGQP
ncbi:HD domain-containing phosphohydrolase [Clostridium yunnanense]|nr:HD domain-containing phosphohydrolase [Clostridium yunnanense]